MEKLHALAKKLQQNNYTMTDEIKDEFEDFLSIIVEGSRIYHPIFGLGTVLRTQGNTWVIIRFDNDVKRNNEIINRYKSKNKPAPYYNNRSPERAVYISKCISIHTLLKENMRQL